VIAPVSDPIATLDEAVPDAVRQVCRTLREARFEAWAVGGAVRDALLGRPIGDWDVATSAHPDQVQELFSRTIPTGVQHGTVTVLVGKGRARASIEVTTFRGEGAYTDSRRPDTVVFGVPLVEDLARRDLVINAIAYDPIGRTIADPFGGQDDLAARRIRAVGDPAARFSEDGLRVMRAIRFAAVLAFELDAETEAAIGAAVPSLEKVSRERVRDELCKMLAAPRPSPGLELARRTGVLASILPELSDASQEPDRWARLCARVDAAAPSIRLAALLCDRAAAVVDGALRRLRLSNAERERAVRLVRFGRAWRAPVVADAELRRLLGRIGRAHADDLLALWASEAASWAERAPRIEALATRARAVLDAGDALAVGDLALRGGDVVRVLGIAPGPAIGEHLEALLEHVLRDPALNTREHLEALLRGGEAGVD
jgi:tRNA nucleotidyltransferase (CCA-adding enzyme)